MKNRTITVDMLARVEGEGGLTVRVKQDKVTEVRFNIFEPPRFFEAFLRNRRFSEAPDITARICGICPVAYQMSSAQAMEAICGAAVEGPLRDLRRLLFLGEWIESHALHVYLLHAPDFLGYASGIHMAADYPDIVKRGLRLKKIGNDVMVLLGGREIHPINIRTGGFYSVPSRAAVLALKKDLEWALEASLETVKWTAGLSFPDFEPDYEMVAIRHPEEYAITEGRIVSNRGIDIPFNDFFKYFEEEHVKHSTSLHARVIERGHYLVGPLARYSLNYGQLPEIAQRAAREAGLGPTCRNPFKSIIVRSVELVFACWEALRLIERYQPPAQPAIPVPPRAGTAAWATEAPRGMLLHQYTLNGHGLILSARIVPPTSQNQKAVEDDLLHFVERNLHLSQEDLTWQCEQVVRNYDPCISCSCHFLKLRIIRE
ncbi:MAG TPA: nickel-dependent hydrogenase large subunit [candidate division Zixibacteria bacterium]|nr:nickel-dependent hydrogenase large subunit [candidate division Zixibacteria bacterium]MDD4917955.1 nickel-dependent hydrogenase large subunit [candidate division Zixibacteria bacterium]MDM7972493.1 nickel-dependent hydrogenase large subunit [candidate division Zixibacteria bacterium]HOD65252.1 nickel-dependent hydrogenase large subunit [candidate division Zixibacteria bacterium]HPI32471.1 nickel-dependent hydrogenase large subunit [candidate division Zixibacteria bacterium]